MIYVAVFESRDIFTELSEVFEACMSERSGVVFLCRLEVVRFQYKSNVCFCRAIVTLSDCGLVHDWRLEVVSVERACILSLAVACFVVFV